MTKLNYQASQGSHLSDLKFLLYKHHFCSITQALNSTYFIATGEIFFLNLIFFLIFLILNSLLPLFSDLSYIPTHSTLLPFLLLLFRKKQEIKRTNTNPQEFLNEVKTQHTHTPKPTHPQNLKRQYLSKRSIKQKISTKQSETKCLQEYHLSSLHLGHQRAGMWVYP